MKLNISPVTKAQWIKVAKALGYSFVATFAYTLLVNPTVDALSYNAVAAASVAGINAVLVTIKQLFTEG